MALAHKEICQGLMKVIELGKVEAAEWVFGKLKHKPVNLNTVVSQSTVLLRAVSAGRADFVELFIRHGANVNWMSAVPTELPELPLHLACEKENVELVKILLKAGADVNKRNYKYRTALCVAVYSANSELVELLLTSGAALDVNVSHDDCPLQTAINNLNPRYRVPMLTTLLRHGAPMNSCDECGFPLLVQALFIQANDAVRLLIECGATLGECTRSSSGKGGNKAKDEFDEWLTEQLSAPPSLKRLTGVAIRLHLVAKHKRSILEHLLKLKLPESLIEYLTLERLKQKPVVA